MKDKFEIRLLSNKFFKDYPKDKYPEISNKNNRPYLVFLFTIDDKLFALPFRSNIKHNYCYKFKNTNRTTNTRTGIDFTKAIIIENKEYLGSVAYIDNLEFMELNSKFYFIKEKFKTFYKRYLSYQSDNKYMSPYIKYSTLQYFLNKKNPIE